MTYVDVTLTPAATYTYVHNGQIYDQIATTLTAHSNWQYVEYVDAISGADTYRRHVWRCKSAGSGLVSDFYVMFQTQFVTATGVYSQTLPVYLALAEAYSGGTMSKMASNKTSITPASDLTNPATWALSTYSAPSSVFWSSNSQQYTCIGPVTTVTSLRLLYIVAKDGIMTNWGSACQSIVPNAAFPTYVGVYDSLLGANDPMPIAIFSYYSGHPALSAGGATRALFQTPGVAVVDVYGIQHGYHSNQNNNSYVGSSNPKGSTIPSTLGSANTNWMISDGGTQVFRAYIVAFVSTTAASSTRGFVRGHPKYIRCTSSAATHSIGDTFLIDGKVHLGLGSIGYGFWDTTAT